MAVGRSLLCLHSHMPYVLSHGKSPHGTDWIFESAAECYLPLLYVLERLEKEGIPARWTMSVTPILAEQLTDETFKSGFEHYCQEKIDAALEDQRKFRREGPLWMEGLAALWQRLYTRALVDFKEKWDRDVIKGLKHFQDIGSIEIVTSCATHGYLPLLGTDESCSAQMQLGAQTYQRHFGRKPRGVWLPECAYRPSYAWKSPAGAGQVPWLRRGVESFVKEQDIEYFFVDSHMIRGGDPLGTYASKFPQLAELFARSSKFFTPPSEFRSEYEHYALQNDVVAFSRDPYTTLKVWSGEHGYPGNEYYLEFHKQLYPGRLRYWRISEDKADLGKKGPYDPYLAFERISEHATDFVATLKHALATYRGLSDRTGTLVAMYDTELFGHWWWEGPEFLYEATRAIYYDPDLESVTGGEVLDSEPPRNKITLPEGSWGEGGYHYVWINDGNYWTWERLYPAERRMVKLAKYAGTPAADVATQAARELLLAESSDWQFLISTQAARDYAEVRFTDHIDRFERLADMADRCHGGAALTTAELRFLEECKQKDAPFKDLRLSLWSDASAKTESVVEK